jgi:hypothetical protein
MLPNNEGIVQRCKSKKERKQLVRATYNGKRPSADGRRGVEPQEDDGKAKRENPLAHFSEKITTPNSENRGLVRIDYVTTKFNKNNGSKIN